MERRRKQYAIRFLVVLFVLGLVTSGLGWISWRPEINISRITVLGNTTVSEEDIRSYLEERLSGGYVRIFSRANVFLFQPKVIEEELRGTFKKIEQVEVSRDSLQSIVVDVSERKPFYLWCTTEAKKEVEQPCYFLDINGYVFAPAPYFSGSVYFEFYKPFVGGNENPIGTYFLPESEFKRLIAFRNSLREINIEPKSLSVLDSGDYSFLLLDGTEVFFNPKQDFDLLFHNLVATFDTEQFSRKRKQGFSLEYIDLRFDNKVYYRFN